MAEHTEGPDTSDELDLLMQVVRADGVVKDVELDALGRIARSYGLEAIDHASLRQAIDKICVASGELPVGHTLPKTRRNVIVRHMIEIARADGEVHASERALINLAAERLLAGGSKSRKLESV